MTERTDKPDILVYPPLASVVAPLVAVALEWLAPLSLLPAPFAFWSVAIGLALVCASGALAMSGTRAFQAAGTNVDPKSPALTLVETGPYRFTRNPMYLGMVLLQLGLAALFSLDWALVLAPVLWAVLHYGVVLREETYLSAKFGAPYDAFLERTRRWL